MMMMMSTKIKNIHHFLELSNINPLTEILILSAEVLRFDIGPPKLESRILD